MLSETPTELRSQRSQDNESGIARDLVAIAEQMLEFSLIGEVTVADHPKFAPWPQYLTRIGKHPRCHGVADRMVFMKRGIVEDAVDAAL